jgi:hypothetical protein
MRLLLTPLLTFFITTAMAQSLTVSQNQINFGNTYDTNPDSVQLTISNPLTTAVDVNGIRFYQIYNSIPFTASDSAFTLLPAASKTLWIKFSPLHNVAHNTEMVLLTNSHRGNVSVDILGQGKYSIAYYNHTENSTEQALKDTLQAITGRGYISLGYNGARDKMFMNVDNKKVNGQGASSNTLECVYTGRNAVGYANRTACQNAPYDFNTEHTYPQTYFASAEPMVSDLFHLYPTDNTANNVRSNYRFGMVTGTPTWTNGGSQYAQPFFEPRDQHKGEVARAMFYFVVRYQNYQGFLTTQEPTLRAWLHSFPPSTIEKKRNFDIHAFQHNYNPFIDYPQFVDRITSISTTSIATVTASVDFTDSIIDFGFISSPGTYQYNYILVNNGNTPVNFSNLNFTNSSLLSFANGTGNNTAVQPGEALTIKINISPSSNDSLVEYLNFDTDLPNALTFHIPIFANFYQLPLGQTNLFLNAPEMQVVPNPSSGAVQLRYALKQAAEAKFYVYDWLGKEVFSSNLNPNEHALDFNLNELKAGIYHCKIQSSAGTSVKKLVFVK